VTVTEDASRFVIAVDAGGTHTRVACFGLDGSLLARASGRGGSPNHNADAADNVAETTLRCLTSGGLDPRDAIGLVAGMASISRHGSNQGDGDNSWAADYFALPSLTCPRVVVNDAVIAHRGALLGRPGIMIVAGTGSMIMAVTDDGTELESGQFEHYAGAARHLVHDVIQLILAGLDGPDDRELVASVLDYWGVDDVPGLRTAILGLSDADRMTVRRRYGLLAPAVTAVADISPIADRALRGLAEKTARGVHLLAPVVHPRRVLVAAAGSLATTDAFADRLSAALEEHPDNRTVLTPAALDPIGGAALIAYQNAEMPVRPALVDRLLLGAASSC
jgi:glucosamine kinase